MTSHSHGAIQYEPSGILAHDARDSWLAGAAAICLIERGKTP